MNYIDIIYSDSGNVSVLFNSNLHKLEESAKSVRRSDCIVRSSIVISNTSNNDIRFIAYHNGLRYVA